MSSEKHEMVCYNDDCYICIYTRQKEERCCCFSLHDLAKYCENNTKGKLFPVFIADIEYLKMFVNLSILSIPHPDLAVAFLCPNGKLYIRLIEVKKICPGGNERFKVDQIRKAIDDQLVNFFNSEGIQSIINKFSNVDENNIKFALVVPQNTYEEINEILNPHKLSKLLKKYDLPDLRSPARKELATGRVEVVPCIALDPSCYRP